MTTSREKNELRKLPMMPIRDMVIFPYMMTPFVVGRLSSVRALEEALNGDRKIFLATQHDASIDEPKAKERPEKDRIASFWNRQRPVPDDDATNVVSRVEADGVRMARYEDGGQTFSSVGPGGATR